MGQRHGRNGKKIKLTIEFNLIFVGRSEDMANSIERDAIATTGFDFKNRFALFVLQH